LFGKIFRRSNLKAEKGGFMSSKKANVSKSEPENFEEKLVIPKEKNYPTLEKLNAQDEEIMASTFEREDKKLMEWMVEHPKEVIEEWQYLLHKIQKKRCGAMGGTIPITLSPLFLRKKSLKLLSDVVVKLDQIVDKVIDLYFVDEHVRSYFPYPDIPKEWIDWDPGYKKPTVLNRHDALFDGKTLKFIEFNTDNPGGRGRTDILEGLYRNYPIYKNLISGYGKPWEGNVLRKGMDSMLSCYREYGGKKEKPRIGIVSFKQYLAGSDNEIVRDYLIEHGCESNFVDARDLEYRNGGLYSGNVQFDILNIALRFTFFKRFPAEMKDFLHAIRDRAVCSVNPFRAIIGAHKELLSFITNDRNHHYFKPDEVECIRAHVPWTRKLDETITISKEGMDISLEEYMIRKQEELVLKPTDAAGGYGVMVGKSTDKGEWRDAVESYIGCPWWIVQEAINIPEIDLPVIKDNKVVLEKKFLNINPYVFNGEYAGILGRVSDKTVVNVCAGGGIIPVIELSET